MRGDLLIAGLIGFMIGNFTTIILLALCSAGKGDEEDVER